MNLRWYRGDGGETVLQVETAYGWEDVPVVSAEEERQQEFQRAMEDACEAEQRARVAEIKRRRWEDPRVRDFEKLA